MEAAMERWNTLAPEYILTETYRWRIDNFSTLSKGKKYSPIFSTNTDQKWRILVYPKGNGVDHLSAYLDVVGASELPLGWSRLARFKLVMENGFDDSRCITKETVHVFNKKDRDWGFTSYIPLDVLNDYTRGYVVNDTCIIRAHVSVPKTPTTLANEAGSSALVPYLGGELPLNAVPTRVDSPVPLLGGELPMIAAPTHADSPVVKEEPFLSSLPTGLTANFRGYGAVDQAFIPLLEEFCSLRPSLVECVQDKGEVFTQWAFTALGRLLYFLNTGEPEKLTEQTRRDLRNLWQELQVFRFDLSWVKDDFERALGMKDALERAKKLREEVNALDTQRKRLKAKLTAMEGKLEEAQQRAADAADAEQLIEGGLSYRTRLRQPPS